EARFIEDTRTIIDHRVDATELRKQREQDADQHGFAHPRGKQVFIAAALLTERAADRGDIAARRFFAADSAQDLYGFLPAVAQQKPAGAFRNQKKPAHKEQGRDDPNSKHSPPGFLHKYIRADAASGGVLMCDCVAVQRGVAQVSYQNPYRDGQLVKGYQAAPDL